ncbi:MAG: hypothetical protein HQL71_14985 [Magnetococcales bacterium]|nr:hypothetical protein [Magnetococcales bacterium]
MFLVTTSDERTWKTDENILFLGEWCRLYSRKQEWSKLNHEVLPYHWNNRKKLYKDSKYLVGIYEKYLELYAEKLNKIHGYNHSLRYWRIVIGPWLHFFIETIYDRYISIKACRDRGDINSVWLLQSDPWCWVPNDSLQLYEYAYTDAWNGFIYGEIIKFLDCIPYKEISIDNSPPNALKVYNKSSIPKSLLKFLLLYSNTIPDSWKKIVFFDSGFGEYYMVSLSLKLKQIPFWFNSINIENPEAVQGFRQNLILSSASSEFEKLLEKLVPIQMPKVYLEGYLKRRQSLLSHYPKKPEIIVTANGYNSNDTFKIWAAEKTAQGAKLVIVQHGGLFGSALWVQWEDHQVAIADKFYIWGKSNRKEPHVIKISGGKLVRAKKRIKAKDGGSLLLVLAEIPRYSTALYSAPLSTMLLDYFSDQFLFLQHLSKPALELMNIRVFRRDFGWGMKQRLQDEGFGHLIDSTGQSYWQALNKSRICISTYNATTYLETFAANYPTIIYWNPDHWELRPAAQPHFDALRQEGILHDTPQSAAYQLNKIYADPQQWWQQANVQDAKNKFCSAFADVGPDWQNEWVRELKK